MDMCLCGTIPSLLHRYDCPYPLFRGSDEMIEKWERARAAKEKALREAAAAVTTDLGTSCRFRP